MKFEKSRLEPLKLELNGIEYPVRVTFNAMAEFEEYFNLPYAEIIDKLMMQNINAKELQFILWVLLKNGGVDVALDDLDDADFTVDTLGVMADALTKANKVVTALAEQSEQESGKDKKKKKRT